MTLPPFDNCIPTGDTVSGIFNYYQFKVPNDDWLVKAVMGQFMTLLDTGAFCQIGTITEAQAAEIATLVYESITQVFPIGQIVPYAGPLPTTLSILACDGASYLRSSYPELFAVIGTTWGAVDGTHFNVPDFRGRALIGDGTGSGLSPRTIGQSLGEENHQLTVSELASHAHSVQEFPLVGTQVPPPLDGVDALPHILNSTGNAGGDQPHNNMQPSAVIAWGIIAH